MPYGDKEEALKALKNYDVLAVYEIGEDFTQEINESIKPTINVYKLEEGNNLKIFEIQIEDKINEMLKVQMLKNNNIINDDNALNKTLVNLEYNTEKKIIPANNFVPMMMIMFFFYIGGMIAEHSTKVPRIAAVLSKFIPFYWSLESIEKGILFPNAFILILMALVFFSAGSIKYSNFAKE